MRTQNFNIRTSLVTLLRVLLSPFGYRSLMQTLCKYTRALLADAYLVVIHYEGALYQVHVPLPLAYLLLSLQFSYATPLLPT